MADVKRDRRGRFINVKSKTQRDKCKDVLMKINREKNSYVNEKGDASSNPVSHLPWESGERRIIEPFELTRQLQEGCIGCGEVLSLTRTVTETRSGLGAILYITCHCGLLNTIYSGKTHHNKERHKTRPIFDVNSKAAIAMYDTGIGHHKVNRFLTDLNIPGMSSSALSKREKEVSGPIKRVAEESIETSLEEEKIASLSKQTENLDPETAIPIKGKYDMCWQKRSRKYDSKSGVGTVIGNETGKVIGIEIRSTDCRTCSYYDTKGLETPEHTCSRNWYGTSKGMEPDVGASIMKSIESQNCYVSTVIMDDDATTISRIRQELQHDVEKWSDIKHVQKTLGNKLYALQHREFFPKDAISHVMKCFVYAVHANKNNMDNLKEALTAIIPHIYGSHDLCDKTWCGFCRNPSGYTPTITLKQNTEVRSKLERIFQDYCQTTNLSKIAPCASTKENESFNNMIATRAPKNRHYCSSQSLETRVHCTVAQKNYSYGYVSSINETCGLSPGKHTVHFGQMTEKKRKYQAEYCSSQEYKKRKANRKCQMTKKNEAYEIREGETYKTNIDNVDVSQQDTTEISSPLEKVEFTSIGGELPKSERVYFDLETTSLSMNCDIIQISALHNNQAFNQYILPSGGINKHASDVTGLSMYGDFLCYQGHKVDAVSQHQGFQNFILWLEENIDEKAVLIGHNSKRFDAPRLVKSLSNYQLIPALKNKISGFVDTLPMFKTMYPNLKSFKQESLVENILKKKYAAHNASADVQMLKDLVEHSSASTSDMQPNSFLLQSVVDYTQQLTITTKCLTTLEPLVASKSCSKAMARKIAESGLDMGQLTLAKRRDETNGVYLVLSEKCTSGKARVTNSKKVSSKISDGLNL